MALYKYSAGVAPFIDLCAGPPVEARAEVAFLRARLRAGAAVLDIGAGVGQLAFALAGHGYPVTTLEPDEGMYGAMLVRAALRDDLRATLTPVQGAIGFDLKQRFDAALALAVMHHLDPAERSALFQYAAVHVMAGGMLVIDTPVESAARTDVPRQLRAERTFGATRFQHWHAVARTARGWQTRWEFVTLRGGDILDQRSQRFDWTTSSPDEVDDLANAAGLHVEEAYAGFDCAPFVAGASRSLVAVVRKPQ